MKKTLLLLVLFVLLPVSFTHASGHLDIMEQYIMELTAVATYLERELGFVSETPLSAQEMREIVIEGTHFLQNAQEENGHFAYEYAPYANMYMLDDNIVRQAGALYQLGEVVRRDTEEVIDLQDTIESSIEFFEELSREDEHNNISFRCIVEDEESSKCKLGATSLALIGMLSYVEAYPEKRDSYEDLIAEYIAYIKASKIEGENEGFRNVHIIGKEFQSEKESSFSNGEAMLALARHYQYENDEEVAVLAQGMFEYLRKTEYDSPLYLWIMAALKDMQKLWPNPDYAIYTKDYTDWRVENVQRYKGTVRNYCAYSEGVVSAYSVLEETATDEEKKALRTEIDYWNYKNSRLQINAIDMYRFVEDEDALMKYVIEDMEQAQGGFLTAENELRQRIDFTQHCISSYLQVLVDIDKEQI